MSVAGIIIWIILVIGSVFCYINDVMGLSTLIEILAGFTISVMAFYYFFVSNKEKMLLIGFTSRYLLEKDDSKLDDLLSILIAGKWKKLQIDPIDEFFSLILTLCYKDDYEIKRRIAEALPALFKINLHETEKIIEFLRVDWDEKKWKSDNRRRTIEALPYIIKKSKNFVKKTIQLKPNDEIFTVIAIVELMYLWKVSINNKGGDKLFLNLIEEMTKLQYSKKEIASINRIWAYLDLTNNNKEKALQYYNRMKYSSDIILQIGIARNLKNLCCGYPKCKTKNWCSANPETMLNAMAFFLDKNQHNHVRRPIARGEMFECILVLMHFERYAPRTKEIIRLLITDDDEIIQLACFDRIENILSIDAIFGQEILESIIQENKNQILVNRAKTLITRLIQTSEQ